MRLNQLNNNRIAYKLPEKTLENVYSELKSYNNECLDFNYPLNTAKTKLFVEENQLKTIINGVKMTFTPNGFNSLLNELTLPTNYLNNPIFPNDYKCDVINKTLNYINFDSRLFRTHKNNIRAVLSPIYTPFDGFKLAELLLNFPNIKPDTLTLTSYSKDMKTQVIKLIVGTKDKAELFPNGKEDSIYRVGFMFMNSELGIASLRVSNFIERLICTNGLTSTEKNNMFRLIHRGNIDFNNFVKTCASVGSKCANLFVDLMKSKTKLIETPSAFLDKLAVKFNIQKNIDTIVRATLLNEQGVEIDEKIEVEQYNLYPKSLFEIVNAFTSTARYYEDSQRVEIEGLASKVLIAGLINSKLSITR